jgi:hypothetical protein
MFNHTLKHNQITPENPKVIFDTNAYRVFVERYLQNGANFSSVINKLKDCEKKYSIIPSSNLITILELYQHLKDDDKAYSTCKKAILFSFSRSYNNGSFSHQPLPEIEIAARLFENYSDNDMQLNRQFLNGHINFCIENENQKLSATNEFVDDVCKQLEIYKETFHTAIIKNIQRLFPSFNANIKKFSKQDSEIFKKKFSKKRMKMYRDLGVSIFEGFKTKLNIEEDIPNAELLIIEFIIDCQPVLHSCILMWEKFSNNKHTSKSPFVPDKNDLMDSLILFSIVPNENVFIVTEEKMIHKIFNEIGFSNFVYKLDDYLREIGFLSPLPIFE